MDGPAIGQQQLYGHQPWFTSAVVNASTGTPPLLYRMGVVYAHQSIKNGLTGATPRP